MSVNKVMLLGNLGKDPELRFTTNQHPVCSFSLATTDRRKDQSGTWVDQTEWHNIVVYGKTAENCSTYLKKGRQAFIEGKIRTRKWQDKEGKDRYTTEIIADAVQFVGGRDGSGKASGGNSDAPTADTGMDESVRANTAAPAKKAAVGAPAEVSFDDDDIPF